jgi:hypothetical protein
MAAMFRVMVVLGPSNEPMMAAPPRRDDALMQVAAKAARGRYQRSRG